MQHLAPGAALLSAQSSICMRGCVECSPVGADNNLTRLTCKGWYRDSSPMEESIPTECSAIREQLKRTADHCRPPGDH